MHIDINMYSICNIMIRQREILFFFCSNSFFYVEVYLCMWQVKALKIAKTREFEWMVCWDDVHTIKLKPKNVITNTLTHVAYLYKHTLISGLISYRATINTRMYVAIPKKSERTTTTTKKKNNFLYFTYCKRIHIYDINIQGRQAGRQTVGSRQYMH